MVSHSCTEHTRLSRIEKILDGNGQPGLVKDVIEIVQKVENMEKNIESLAHSYSALAQSQIEFDVTEKLKVKMQEKKYQMIKIISIIFGIVIPLTALIFNLKL